ncbi:MAG: hypothetical protein HY810_04745 [Candidatus Omnitrophica bacterium]|nr:hypothetical protein [Candidatus Omnitrophota bacterium]
MKTKKIINKNGFALLITLIILVILFILGTAYLSSIISEVAIAQNHEKSEKAFFIAEAGMERAIRLLLEDNSWRTASLIENLGEGNYTLVVDQDPVHSNRIRITSTGTIGKVKRITRITLIITTGFNYSIFAGDTNDPAIADINCSGSSGTVNGDVHANGSAIMGGLTIKDGVLTQGESGGQIENIIQIDMAFHKAEATIIYPNNTVINAEKIQNQLIYVEGNVTIDCSANKGVTFLQSSLIAEGNITITGANIFKVDEYNYPGHGKVVALASLNGDIVSTGATKIQNRDIKGLLFTQNGKIDFDYLKIDSAVYAQNVILRKNIDIDYKIKRFPTVGFIFGVQFFDWEEVF